MLKFIRSSSSSSSVLGVSMISALMNFHQTDGSSAARDQVDTGGVQGVCWR